jgi:hypothetical protein
MEEREISLKELFDVVWKGKWLIAICAVIVFVLAAAGSFIYDNMTSQVATIVSLQWNGVGSGEYPDGSRFDYSDAIEPYVITLAIDQLVEDGVLEEALVTNEVRSAMTFTPIVPNNVLALIQTALEEGEEYSYFATDYRLVMDNGTLGITVDESRELINEIITQFRLDFERKFINQTTVIDFTDANFEDYDYIDAYDILNAQISAIESAMEPRVESGFYSPTLGITFNDILVRTDLLSRIELSQIITRTNNYLLSKDKEYLITSYEYRIEIAQLALDKATAKELEAQDLVDNYTGSVTTVVIPGLENENFTLDTYYNTLMDNLVNLQNEVADYTQDIEYYELQIDRLNGDDPDFSVTPQQQADETVKVETNIASADAELEDIVNDANILLNDYNLFLTSNIIKPLMTPAYQSSVSTLIISAIGIVIGAGIGGVIVLFKHDWS